MYQYSYITVLLFLLIDRIHCITYNAYNQIVYIQPNTDIIINLLPNNSAHDNVIITSLSTSSLYTVSPNYINYGYLPAKWSLITPASPNVNNVSAGNYNTSVVYNCGSSCIHDRFTFVIANSSNITLSNTGIIDLVLSDNILVSTQYNNGNQSWNVYVPSAATPFQPTLYSDLTIGPPVLLSSYITNDAIPPSINKAIGVSQRWYFSSGGDTNWKRNLVNSYNGAISFNIGIFAGDFTTSSNQRPLPLNMIELVCSTCIDTVYTNNIGIILSQRNTIFNGITQTFTFTLNEYNGWYKDPQDTRISNWPSTTQCELLYVLSKLSEIRIWGAYTYGYEVIAIDNISVTVNGGISSVLYSSTDPQCIQALT